MRQPLDILRRQRTKAGYSFGRIEVPRILGQPNEIANAGVARPASPQRRARQFGWHSPGKKAPKVRFVVNGLDRRQTCRIERTLIVVGSGSIGRRGDGFVAGDGFIRLAFCFGNSSIAW